MHSTYRYVERVILLFILVCAHSSNALSSSNPQQKKHSSGSWISDRHPYPTTHAKHEPHTHQASKRREFLQSTMSRTILALGLTPTVTTQPANAAMPLTTDELNNVRAILGRKIRTKPPKLLRPKINQDFAVLLMRSSYNALDDMDVLPMNQFQRDFFLLRQAEYQTYVDVLGTGMVQQGDLTDPYYFDFISYAQYATINREVTVPPLPKVFTEEQPEENQDPTAPQTFVPKIIQRDPDLTDEQLPAEHGKRVAALILLRLDEIFQNTELSIFPQGWTPRPGLDIMAGRLRSLVNIFVINGFCWDGSVSLQGGTFRFELNTPANLWGGQVLLQQNAKISNSFLLNVSKGLLQRYGYIVVSTKTSYEGNKEVSLVTVR